MNNMTLKNSSDKDTPLFTSVHEKVQSALIAHCYQFLIAGLVSSLFCASVVFVALYKNNFYLAIAWYAFYICIFLFRTTILKTYSYQKNPKAHAKLWINLFIFSAMLSGIAWGAVGTVLFAHAINAEKLLLIVVLAGVTAGAAPLLAAELRALIAFLSFALIPLMVQLLYFEPNNEINTLFGAVMIAYYFYLIALSTQLHKMIKDALQLKFENDLLLENISKTKTQLEVFNKKLAHAATHDPLTHVPNRNLFEDNLINSMKRAKDNNEIMALLYIDLDNFKEINDAYGHHIGDQLLIEVVTRLKKGIHDGEAIARLGGDELTLILENIYDPDMIFTFAAEVCALLSNPIIIQSYTIAVTASIGIAIYPIDGEDTETLLKNADKAMYAVKGQGGNNIRFSTESAKLRTLLNLTNKSSDYAR